jgi:hypothetical protein
MSTRFLTSSDLAAGRAAQQLSRAKQAEFAEDFDREVFKAHRGWTWGRKAFRLEIGQADLPPATVYRVCSLEAIEYIAIKKDPVKGAQRAAYRHKHDSPYATIVTTRDGAREMHPELVAPEGAERSPHPYEIGAPMSSRGVPRMAGPAVFALGDLHGIEGRDERGFRLYWRAPKGLLLVGCPRTDTMHVLRRDDARRDVSPIWIVRGRSPYRITDRGIDR